MNSRFVDEVFTALKAAEELGYPNAVLLKNFPRLVQLDSHSCGLCCVKSILQYQKIHVSRKRLKELLRTDLDGTAVSDIKRVLNRFGLECRTLRKPGLRDLKAAIDKGCPVLISTWLGEHFSTCYGYSTSSVFISNPSIDFSSDGVGSLRCAIRKDLFRKEWDRWGIIVSRPK